MSNVARMKLPPHSIEAEQSLLGALMMDRTAFHRVAARVRVDDLYRADHRIIFAAIERVTEDGMDPDAVTVGQNLQRFGQLEAVGGLVYLAQLVQDTPSAASVESYARIVHEHAVKRGIGLCGQEVMALMHGEESAADALAHASRLIGELHGGARVGRGLVQSRTLIGELLDELDRRRAGERGLATGLDDFDRLSFGLDPGDLVVIAGRPGMGKTALLVTIAANVSRTAGVAVFSAEMPANQLMRRAVALVSGVSQSALRYPVHLEEHHWKQIDQAAGAISDRRLWVDDTPAPSLEHLRGEVLALANRSSIGLVMVDYVQLVQGSGSNRYEQLRDVAYGLKALAKEAKLPIVMLAQLNRGIESREQKRPRLADLRDSGAIEEAADMVGMLYSEGYYDKEFSMSDVLELLVEKNRNGERGQCLWRFRGETSHVEPLSDGMRAQYIHLMSEQHRHRSSKDDEL